MPNTEKKILIVEGDEDTINHMIEDNTESSELSFTEIKPPNDEKIGELTSTVQDMIKGKIYTDSVPEHPEKEWSDIDWSDVKKIVQFMVKELFNTK